MKKSVLSFVSATVLSLSCIAGSAQPTVTSSAMGGSMPRPQAMGGSMPRPQAMGGSMPRPQAMGGSMPRPQALGTLFSSFMLYFGYVL